MKNYDWEISKDCDLYIDYDGGDICVAFTIPKSIVLEICKKIDNTLDKENKE